jgi:hypothetical protein
MSAFKAHCANRLKNQNLSPSLRQTGREDSAPSPPIDAGRNRGRIDNTVQASWGFDVVRLKALEKEINMVRHTPPESFVSDAAPPEQTSVTLEPNVNLWMDEQLFEEDMRAVMKMVRPHARERLQGWKEYRTGGAHYRVTVSWDDEFAITSRDANLAVPHMADVIETLIVGSVRNQDDLAPVDEYEQYRQVVRDVYQRLTEQQSRYE